MDFGVCECGSRQSAIRHDGTFCESCGVELMGPEMDPGFAPSAPLIRRGGGFPGSSIGNAEGFKGSRLRLAHNISTRRKALFIDDLESKLRESGEERTVVEAAASLLREVDSGHPLGMRRRSLKGASGMSRADSRDYRLRVFAAAALHVLNDRGLENRAPMVSERWGISYHDIAWGISILNRHRRRNERRGVGVTPEKLRKKELRFNLNRLREFLASKAGFEEAGEIMQSAVSRLSSEGEPIGGSEEWLSGRFCNMPSKRASMVAFAEEMSDRGKPKGMIRWLREQVPIIGTKDFVSRIRPKCHGASEE